MSTNKLRLITYNVRMFLGANGDCTLDSISADLRRLEPDIVCLNEVDVGKWPDVIPRLEKSLGSSTKVHFFGHAKNGQFGNAICSKLPLKVNQEVHLEGGSVLEFNGKRHQIVRGMVICDVDSSQIPGCPPKFTVANTHLDHIDEGERETQIKHILRVVSEIDSPLILAGDFNALHRPDYSMKQWDKLERRHASRGWNPPSHGCLDLLQENGFIDTFLHHNNSNPDIPKWTASVQEPLYRIDYCFLRSCMFDHFAIHNSFVDTRAMHGDHFPLVLDLHVKPNNSKI